MPSMYILMMCSINPAIIILHMPVPVLCIATHPTATYVQANERACMVTINLHLVLCSIQVFALLQWEDVNPACGSCSLLPWPLKENSSYTGYILHKWIHHAPFALSQYGHVSQDFSIQVTFTSSLLTVNKHIPLHLRMRRKWPFAGLMQNRLLLCLKKWKPWLQCSAVVPESLPVSFWISFDFFCYQRR